MLALPFAAMPSPQTLTRRVWGRFLPRPAAAGPGESAAVAGLAEGEAAAEVDESVPDLAQRVRETGEW
ncbi:hypothetical protein [Acidovorax sp. M2(2025)]|uniref:hypothetical protein n=1 Tax=Acidovorax sp. M2(2025) TaxID=3411355 RepID=UPI003BF57441